MADFISSTNNSGSLGYIGTTVDPADQARLETEQAKTTAELAKLAANRDLLEQQHSFLQTIAQPRLPTIASPANLSGSWKPVIVVVAVVAGLVGLGYGFYRVVKKD